MISTSPIPHMCLPIRRGMKLLPGSLTMLSLIAGLCASPPNMAATAQEICSVDVTPADDLWRCNAPAAVAGVTTVFWAPLSCPTDMEASIPMTNSQNISITNIRFVVFNTKPNVILSATGTTNSEVLVGSPNASEDLQGSGGKNTYVVGGQSSYLLGRGDRAFIYSTSGEMDWVGLSSSAAEFIHISGSLQGNPGNIALASMAGLQPVRGSGELGSIVPPLTTCLTLKLLSSGLEGLIAQPTTTTPKHPCPECLPAKQRVRMGLAGAPTLQGFPLAHANTQTEEPRIFLPANEYRFHGRLLSRQRPISTLVAPASIKIDPIKVVSSAELADQISRADGLSQLRSNSPLVYFPSTGLLVFSKNDSPLGSRRNPGQVIARLLQRDGTPSRAPVQEGKVFQASFVTFTPVRIPR